MKRRILVSVIVISLLTVAGFALAPSLPAQAQAPAQPQAKTPAPEPELKPAIIEQPMPDVTLPLYQGGELSLSSLRGKNVVLIVPRFWAAPGYYCTICNYQYLNLVDVDKTEGFQKRYNAEIVYLFPFGKDDVSQWLNSLPGQMEKIRTTKNPADMSKLDEKGKARMERWRLMFPKDFSLKPNEVPTPFPIMLDPERKFAKPLGVFSTNWSGSPVDQGIPSVFIIDAKGVLMFKYISQNTVDRPSPDYLGRILGLINAQK